MYMYFNGCLLVISPNGNTVGTVSRLSHIPWLPCRYWLSMECDSRCRGWPHWGGTWTKGQWAQDELSVKAIKAVWQPNLPAIPCNTYISIVCMHFQYIHTQAHYLQLVAARELRPTYPVVQFSLVAARELRPYHTRTLLYNSQSCCSKRA